MKFDLSEISDGFSKDETILALMPLYKPAGFIDIAFVTLGFEYEKEGDFLKINIPGAKLGIIQVFDKNKANVYYYQFKGEAIQNSIAIDKKVILYTIDGGGHTWPGGLQYLPERIIGKTSKDLDANQLIWDFFKESSIK